MAVGTITITGELDWKEVPVHVGVRKPGATCPIHGTADEYCEHVPMDMPQSLASAVHRLGDREVFNLFMNGFTIHLQAKARPGVRRRSGGGGEGNGNGATMRPQRRRGQHKDHLGL